MKPYRSHVLVVLLSVGAVGGSFAGATARKAGAAHKAVAAAPARYECTHCNVKVSAKEAKAHGMKCAMCGAKLTAVKPSPKKRTRS